MRSDVDLPEELSETDCRQDARNACPVCRTIRLYLSVAVPVLLLLWFKPDTGVLKQVNLTELSSNGIAVALCLLVLVKAWREFGPKGKP